MDFQTFLIQNLRPIFYISQLIYYNFHLIKLFKERQKLEVKKQQVSEQKILSFSEAYQKLIKSQKIADDNTYLIKAYPQLENNQIKIEKQLTSNQLWLIEPSLNKIALELVSKLKYLHQYSQVLTPKEAKKEQELLKNLNWRIGQKKRHTEKNIPIKGYGEILDHEVFQITTYYKQNKNRGFFKGLWEDISYYSQQIFYSNLKQEGQLKMHSISENPNRAPFFTGPVIGTIRYLLNFVQDRPILLEAKFEAGKLLPLSLSSSKLNLIQSINTNISSVNFSIFLTLAWILFGKNVIRPNMKKFFKDFKSLIKRYFGKSEMELPEKDDQIFRMMGNSKICDDSICIICYTNCRNTILMNCKHMIMCDECYETVKEKNCPLCKTEIKEEIILGQE